MAAPAFGTVGTHLTGTGTTASFAVPASVASGDIIIIPIFVDSTATITAYPTGFAEAENSPPAVTGAGAHSLHLVWKRATGADTGTYDFTFSASTYRAGSAHRYTGCVASGTPFDSPTNSASETTNNTVSPAVSITTAGPDRMLIWASTNWAGGTWTPPTGFTERMDTGDGTNTLAEKVQASAGASGSITGTCTGSDKRTAWLGGLIGTTGGTTAVGKDLGLVWNTRQAVGDTVQAIWDTRQSVGDPVVLQWDTRQAVGDPIDLQWSVRQAIGNTAQLVWDTRQAVGDSVQAVWDVRLAIGDPLDLRWSVRQAVGDPVQLIWNVESSLTAVGKDLALQWHTRAAIGAIVQAIWNTRQAVGDTLDLQWAVRALAGDTLQLIWNVLSDTTTKATSNPTITAPNTSTPTVGSGYTSTPTVSSPATSSSTVT